MVQRGLGWGRFLPALGEHPGHSNAGDMWGLGVLSQTLKLWPALAVEGSEVVVGEVQWWRR